MTKYQHYYINGKWIVPDSRETFAVVDPSTEQAFETIILANRNDVDAAVRAARKAFATFSRMSVEDRLAMLTRIGVEYERRIGEIAEAISNEMGAPITLARTAQAPSGSSHIKGAIATLRSYQFAKRNAGDLIVKEPIGVCAMITPWNWPMNQAVCKVVYALAAGCTMVLKPSEETPISAHIFAEILDAAGVPAGVFNLIHGDGPSAGSALSSHPDVDMVSFTGSTVAGISVAKAAADTVKRVSQELGGKSPNIILEDADLAAAVTRGANSVFRNSGQTCTAPTRMLVPVKLHEKAVEIAIKAAESAIVGAPSDFATTVGPLVNAKQFDRVQRLIQRGIDEGATLVAGGLGRPALFNAGYYAQPTVFANVNTDMVIAREEIFGPVLSILPYEDEDDAIRIANETNYGLSSQIWSTNPQKAYRVALQIKAGNVLINGSGTSGDSPFGGMKQSGNGREQGEMGLEEYLETKVISGAAA